MADKIIGLVIVKNEIDIIKTMLDKNGRFMDFIIIDNGSTDGSYEVIKAHPKVLKYEQDSRQYDENRLSKQLTSLSDNYKADWYFEINSDEIIDDHFADLNLSKIKSNTITFQIHYRLLDNRCYKIYNYWQRLYRNLGKDTLLSSCDKETSKLHKGRNLIARENRTFYHSNIPIHHYQVRSYEQGIRKYNNYLSLDTGLKYQPKGYEHIKGLANMLKTGDFTGLKFIKEDIDVKKE